MSAPDTRVKKQTRRHIGPLIGIALMLLVAGVLFMFYLGDTADTDTPTAADPVIERPLPAEGVPVTPRGEASPPPQVIEQTPAPTE